MGNPKFTGERFLPDCAGEIAYEHWHRYVFARQLATDKTVLDIASGDGYGAALLSGTAKFVYGVDIDQPTVRKASAAYRAHENLSFIQADGRKLPFPNRMFDLIVSFETIEHIDARAQTVMLQEFARLLAPGGALVISSPNRRLYSDARKFVNEFHVHELYEDELRALLEPLFPMQRWFHQRGQFWSGIWDATAKGRRFEAWTLSQSAIETSAAPDAMYYVVVASRTPITSLDAPHLSLLIDRDDSITRQYETNTQHLIEQYKLNDDLIAAADRQTHHIRHLEELLSEREKLSDKQALHIRHLEELLAEREQLCDKQTAHVQHLECLINERDAQIAQAQEAANTFAGQVDQLMAQIEDLTTQVSERERWRWWVNYPSYRIRRLWQR